MLVIEIMTFVTVMIILKSNTENEKLNRGSANEKIMKVINNNDKDNI